MAITQRQGSTEARRTTARLARRATRRLWGYGLASLLGLVLIGGSGRPTSATPRQPQPAYANQLAQASQPPVAPAPAAAGSQMDEPLRLLGEARQSFQGVRDYTCVLVKRERLRGQLAADNVINMKVRNQPFSVYLRWQSPKDLAGQEACYVAGRNNGMMRVHSTGLIGAVGFVSIDPRDPRAQANSRHAITEAGIGNLIERFAKHWDEERRLNLTQVRVGDYEYNKRRCTRVETVHPDNRGNHFTSYRTVLFFDQENHLPIRIEVYGWPRAGGPAEGELLESYSYVNLRLNAGLGEDSFNY